MKFKKALRIVKSGAWVHRDVDGNRRFLVLEVTPGLNCEIWCEILDAASPLKRKRVPLCLSDAEATDWETK